MKAYVDKELCIGCGVCVDSCPKVFHLDDDGLAEAISDELNEDIVDDVKQTRDECPVEAIHVE